MSEQSRSLNVKWNLEKYITWTDILVFIGSVSLMSLNDSPYRFIWILPYLSFWYQRNQKEWIYAISGVLVISLWQGWQTIYQNGLILLFFILLIQFIQLLRQNIYLYLPYLCAITAVLSALVFDYSWQLGILSAFITLGLSRTCQSDWMWIDTEFKLSEGIFALLCLGVVFICSNFISMEVLFYIIATILFISGLCVSLPTILMITLSLLFFYPLIQINMAWLLAFMSGWIMKKDGDFFAAVCFSIVLVALEFNLQSIIVSLVVVFLASFLPLDKIQAELLKTQDLALGQQRIESKRKLITHQLSQFSSIFTLISQYYHKAYPNESTFCEGMSFSLDYLALELKSNMNRQEDEYERIMQVLSGYHYEVTKLRIEEKMEGRKQITIHFSNLDNSDIQDVILPLLKMVIDKNLEVVQLQKNKLFNGFYVVQLATNFPVRVQTQSFHKKTNNACSGDMISIFRHEHATICLLSDGMGTGEKAAKAAQFIISMVQRMIYAKMPIESIVRSMNKLLRLENKEQFATLDVLYIDESKKEAYLSKSGACPTYLLRQGNVMELKGESLPIGIIEEIEADCYRLKCENNDIFMMVSDGIETKEIKQWLKETQYNILYQKIKTKMDQVDFLDHQDDATVLIANFLER